MRTPRFSLTLLVGGILFPLAACVPSIDEADLARRCVQSRPEWNNYDEDIKAQIGATAAAQWDGEPLRAHAGNGQVQVTFAIRGPWEKRSAALPVLMRDPYGNTLRDSGEAGRNGSERTYTFILPAATAEGSLPWIEIKYLHHERRLVPE